MVNHSNNPSPAARRKAAEALIGQRFGLLVVVEVMPPGFSKTLSGLWVRAVCDCGGEKTLQLRTLREKRYGWDHCGCLTPDRLEAARQQAIAKNAEERKSLHCQVDGCANEYLCKGLCKPHYERRYHTGSTEMPIRTSRSSFKGSKGYRLVMTDAGRMLEHRWVMEQELGRALPPHENVHHINGVRDDNRPENLELWTTTGRGLATSRLGH